MKVAELETHDREITNKLVNLEREKRAILQKSQYLEERLQSEKIRADGAEHAKDIAVVASDGMRKHFDFYRNYYEAQAGLYGQYFGANDKYSSSRPTTPKSTHTQSTSITAVEGKENSTCENTVSKSFHQF